MWFPFACKGFRWMHGQATCFLMRTKRSVSPRKLTEACVGCSPHKEELQVWANQLLCKGFGLDGLQSQADNRSTMVELMKLMRQPGAGALGPALPHLSAAPEAPQASLSVERVWDYGKVSR